ncbi:uracil-DNA glycosylase family protein [Aliikangiella coralliicola]|uniref:Uracil-DNA glycosylase family protein n=1 Tax=Aliikangiella coralliicola TaxID=2592383 RepID=A0A545U7N9_9GAMM|nr:uracil-DNA glycosylase family protein [Aliikangiella coralliicola]TQV85423.1 uracil-DNA glycosylase family protein [Aliikangiella coralliicola]
MKSLAVQLDTLKSEISQCRLCESNLPLGPNPVFRASVSAKILIAAQAPGTRVHETGIPFNDPSGVRLRDWLGVDDDTFYDASKIAIIPMGFCYPGKGKSGDLPPRLECSQTWHKKLLPLLPNIQLTLTIGQYSQRYYLGKNMKRNLTETVRAWKEFAPDIIPLPHPSPRNNIWLKKNPWFEREIVGHLKQRVNTLI